MDHCEILRPLFSYVAHLTASPVDAADYVFDPLAARRDLERLAETARARLPRDDEDAWLAIAAWMAERLSGIPEGAALAQAVLPYPDNWESEFYRRLNLLLSRDDFNPGSRELAIIEVYSLCLDLGFHGYYARPGLEHHLDGYRNRCREVLATARSHRQPSISLPTPPSRTRTLALSAAMWAAPAAVTVLLYALYRWLLSDMYSTILG